MRSLKNEKGNVTAILLVIVMIILVVGVSLLIYNMYPTNQKSEISAKEIRTAVSLEGESEGITVEENNYNINFSDFSKLFENTKKYNNIFIESDYSYIEEVYLYNGNVYVSIRESAVSEKDKAVLDKLKKEKVSGIEFVDGSTAELYKLPVSDIIIIDKKEIGQDGAGVLLMENNQGEVFYISLSQQGAYGYEFFKNNNEINVKKSKMNNIIDFRNYGTDAWNVYGVDINGKEIEFTDLN